MPRPMKPGPAPVEFAVVSILFNHETDPAKKDFSTTAMNIRHDLYTSVELPEWQATVGNDTVVSQPVAYSVMDVIEGSGPQIVVKLEIPKGTGGYFVRALDVSGPLGPIPWTPVNFSSGLGTASITLEHTKIGPTLGVQGVSVTLQVWHWQCVTAKDFALYFKSATAKPWFEPTVDAYNLSSYTTSHEVYTTRDIPKLPWLQAPYTSSNIYLPWARLMKIVCALPTTLSSTGTPEAAILTSLGNLLWLDNPLKIIYNAGGTGLEGGPKVSTVSLKAVLEQQINLQEALDGPESFSPYYIGCNCTVVSKVSALAASIVGLPVVQGVIYPKGQENDMHAVGQVVQTRVVRPLGQNLQPKSAIDSDSKMSFFYHQVALLPGVDGKFLIFDLAFAVVALESPNPAVAPTAKLKFAFGKAYGGVVGYKASVLRAEPVPLELAVGSPKQLGLVGPGFP